MAVLALFGIENDALNLVVNLLVLFLVALWLALVFYTYKDASRRISDSVVTLSATLASLAFPYIGTVVYMILRPPEYLDDVRERELEIAAAEARLLQMQELACPYCAFPAERSFLRCPNCLKRLKEPCPTCRKPLDARWKICPYCEAEIRGGAPERRRRRPASQGRQSPASGERGAPERPSPRSGSRPRPAAPSQAERPSDGLAQRTGDSSGARQPAQRGGPEPAR